MAHSYRAEINVAVVVLGVERGIVLLTQAPSDSGATSHAEPLAPVELERTSLLRLARDSQCGLSDVVAGDVAEAAAEFPRDRVESAARGGDFGSVVGNLRLFGRRCRCGWGSYKSEEPSGFILSRNVCT